MEIVQLFAARGYECKTLFANPTTGHMLFQVGDYNLLKWARGWSISRGFKNFGSFDLSPVEIVDKMIEELAK